MECTFGSSPSAEFTSEFDANDLWTFQFPGETRHDIDGIGSADTNRKHTKTTTIRSVRIRSNHETTGTIVSGILRIYIQCVIFKNYLMDNTRSRSPETDVKFRT